MNRKMTSFTVIEVVCFLSVIILSDGYPYNDFKYASDWPQAPRYPENCCQLEWRNITRNDPLPDDYVQAGSVFNRNWAFTRTNYPSTAAKSDQKGEEPNWLGLTARRQEPYPILVNPNKCSIGWYTTKVNKEKIPENKDWFFPSLGVSEYGDFLRYQGSPARNHRGSGDVLLMETTSRWKLAGFPSHYDILYVDCKKSNA